MPKLATKEYCTGCTACASACLKGCIAMTADENGFSCPVIDAQKCVECSLCEKACPIMTSFPKAENTPKAYAAYSNDEQMRLDSSSGGIFTEIAKAILQQGGAVFGAAYNNRFEVVHICVEDEENLAKLRGAKYAQSDLRDTFEEVKRRLDRGQNVLFSGTPCQVGGLKAFLHKEYENLLTVDFVCHSVPSPMAWQAYVQYRAKLDHGGELPETINLRAKKPGWSHYQYSNLFQYPNGTNHVAKSGESLYMKLFVGGYINRASCANCQFKGYSRISDLTIGDFWGIWDIAPEMDDNKGTSVLLVQSKRGAELLDQISNRLTLEEVSCEEASRQNPAMIKTSAQNDRRQSTLALIQNGRFAECEKLFVTPRRNYAHIFLQKIKVLVNRLLQ